MSEFLLHVLTMAAIYGLMAVALNIQAGYAGLLNLGHIAFVGVGAYSVGISYYFGVSPLLGIPAGILLSGVLGFFMSRLGRNLGADYWGIATLAVAEIIRTIALNEDWLTGGAQGIGGIPRLFNFIDRPWDQIAFFAAVLLVLWISVVVSQRLDAGAFGRALRLMREEPQLAISLGYNLVSLKSRATIASGMIAAVAGVFLAYYMSFVGPDYMLAAETFLIWTMVMIGGLGNVRGVLLGAFIVQGIYSAVPFAKDIFGIGSDVAGAVRLGLIGLLLLACLLWRKDGLLPERLRRIQ